MHGCKLSVITMLFKGIFVYLKSRLIKLTKAIDFSTKLCQFFKINE